MTVIALWFFLTVPWVGLQYVIVVFPFELWNAVVSCPATCTSLHVRTSKTLISLRIRAVWSESLMGALWIAKDPMFLQAENYDSDQIMLMHMLI